MTFFSGAESAGGGGDITAIAVFAVASPSSTAHAAQMHSTSETPTAADSECQLLLVYASSSFADERVCARAKLLTLWGDSSGGSWDMSREADLLHPPAADTPHFNVTCITGHMVCFAVMRLCCVIGTTCMM